MNQSMYTYVRCLALHFSPSCLQRIEKGQRALSEAASTKRRKELQFMQHQIRHLEGFLESSASSSSSSSSSDKRDAGGRQDDYRGGGGAGGTGSSREAAAAEDESSAKANN
jgi:hypothetical protein